MNTALIILALIGAGIVAYGLAATRNADLVGVGVRVVVCGVELALIALAGAIKAMSVWVW